ncbi:hypothetical protein B0H17DRAFT_1218873 [Mycena rosella]|uniref:Uncharacterized protein n=1 Tax=Mycena rosella TaxID=1033263 RepID=A0AAD7FI27_MYCRO|nr:hypothetical protein B0H17DRAFT_1218873 [Mycena rosella]
MPPRSLSEPPFSSLNRWNMDWNKFEFTIARLSRETEISPAPHPEATHLTIPFNAEHLNDHNSLTNAPAYFPIVDRDPAIIPTIEHTIISRRREDLSIGRTRVLELGVDALRPSVALKMPTRSMRRSSAFTACPNRALKRVATARRPTPVRSAVSLSPAAHKPPLLPSRSAHSHRAERVLRSPTSARSTLRRGGVVDVWRVVFARPVVSPSGCRIRKLYARTLLQYYTSMFPRQRVPERSPSPRKESPDDEICAMNSVHRGFIAIQ